MDRFFSKLDLRDIKIDPERSKYSPDDEFETELDTESAVEFEVQDDPNAYSSEHAPANDDWTNLPSQPKSIMNQVPSVDGTGSASVLKVSSKSRPSAVAGAIAGVVRENGRAEVQAIGAGATNQAIKAVAIARDYLSETGIDAICVPAFIDITIDNEDRTAIRLVVEPR